MTKKHFIDFAKTIRAIDDPNERLPIADLVAEVCSRHSGAFDRNRFLEACGL